MRVAALEDNVAFLEEWCEEQQDVLDRAAGPVSYDYEIEPEPEPEPEPALARARAVLRVVDLRDGALTDLEEAALEADSATNGRGSDADTLIVAVIETAHERKVRQIRARLDRLKGRLSPQR